LDFVFTINILDKIVNIYRHMNIGVYFLKKAVISIPEQL